MRKVIFVGLFLLCTPAYAWVHGTSSLAYNGIYQGNPNISISSITPIITCSRSGTIQTPAFIQCSASATTASGTNNPYEDLEYTWNFGDPTGTETFTHPISGNSVNANNKQWGPEATYVYRTASATPYTITLNVRGCESGGAAGGVCASGVYTTASATYQITVSAFSASGGTFYYSAAGSGTTCSSGAPCAISQFASKLASHTIHHFNCGDTFSTAGTSLDFGSGTLTGVRLDAAGAGCPGAAPIIQPTSGSAVNALYLQTGSTSGSKTDIVISGISFSDGGTVSSFLNGALCVITAGGGGTPGTLSDVYLDFLSGGGCSETLGIGGTEDISIQPSTANFFNVAIWGGTFSSPLTGTNCIGILGGSQQWYSVLGTTVSGNGNNDTTRCHHIYIHAQYHVLARWNVGGKSDPTGTSPTRNYSIKDSFDCTNCTGGIVGGSNDGVPGYVCSGACVAQYHLISENKLFGTFYGRNMSNNNNDPTATVITQNIDQQNQYNNLPGRGSTSGGTGILQPWTAKTVTVRDDQVCNPGDQWFTPNGNGNSVVTVGQIYRNKYYQNTGASVANHFDGFLIYGSPTAITWLGGSPLKQIVTDNIVEDTGTTILTDYIKSTDWVTAGSVIDRNSYFVPNVSGNYLSNNGTGVSFATWQTLGSPGWDVNGSTSSGTPGWPSPATCGFGAWPFN